MSDSVNRTREDWVQEFRTAADAQNYDPANPSHETSNMIMNCIAEEFNEFVEAAVDHEMHGTVETRAQLCKEWADLQYTVSQAALYYDIPASAAFVRVAKNNLTKVADDGKIKRREDGKILKPDNYVKADMRGL